nr:retrovirus-related Pol polyprotein from transposon TNT 1-94 [Tanacetum cinerariifolium]
MSFDTKLMKDEECESIDSTKYQGMIGSLLYLTASRPDIMFSVCLCARFQEAPKTSHLEVVKRIFRYIKGTTHLGSWYLKGSGIETIVYADSDRARDYLDRKGTIGICTFMGCCLTSWFLKKQTTLAISTTEAEAENACQQALWIKQALIDYDVRLDDILIMCDNKGAIDLSKNPGNTLTPIILLVEVAEDVLVDVAEHAYLVDFVILDIKEDEKRPFILGIPFLTMAKAVIKFDKEIIIERVIFDKKKLERSSDVFIGRFLEDDLTSYHMFLLHY